MTTPWGIFLFTFLVLSIRVEVRASPPILFLCVLLCVLAAIMTSAIVRRHPKFYVDRRARGCRHCVACCNVTACDARTFSHRLPASARRRCTLCSHPVFPSLTPTPARPFTMPQVRRPCASRSPRPSWRAPNQSTSPAPCLRTGACGARGSGRGPTCGSC